MTLMGLGSPRQRIDQNIPGIPCKSERRGEEWEQGVDARQRDWLPTHIDTRHTDLVGKRDGDRRKDGEMDERER